MLNIYELFIDEEAISSSEIIYFFKTQLGVTYFIRFSAANGFFHTDCQICNLVYSVDFEHSGDKDKFDEKVRTTICKAIELFMIKMDCPLLYVCDDTDGKGICRSRLFKNWFQKSSFEMDITLDERVYIFDDLQIKLGLLSFAWDIHRNNYLDHFTLE